MSIIDLSIKRPVLVTMFLLVFVVFGVIAYFNIPLSLIPTPKIPYVTVQTIYPGAGPLVIESQVTKKIEDEVASLAQLDSITSYSIEGASIVMVKFKIGKDEDLATQEVKDKVDAILDKLPTGAKRPTVTKLDIGSSFPVMNIVLEGAGDMDATQLRTLADNAVKDRLAQVEGVGEVDVAGGREREIRVELGRDEVYDRSLSLLQVAGLLQAANLEVPAGNFKDGGQDLSVRFKGEFGSLGEMADLDLPSPTGVVKLRQIADVRDTGTEVRERVVFLDNEAGTRNGDAILLKVLKNPSANTVKIVDQIKAALPGIEKDLGGKARLRIIGEDATFVRDSVDDTLFNVVLAIALTALVLLFFLHDLRSTLIIVLAMPFSIIATFMIMRAAGISLNILSLMGLSTSTGILVSDAVVVLESIFRYKSLGAGKAEAASRGTREVTVAVIASTLTHIAVFVPMANMSGVMGSTMGDFAYTIVFATVFSVLMSFTLTPMMASRILPERTPEPGRLGRLLDRMFASWERGYAASVRALVANKRRSAAVVSASLLLFVASAALFPSLKFELLPQTDGGKIEILVELPLGSDIDRTASVCETIESRLKGYREVGRILTDLGYQSDMDKDVNLARMDVTLVPKTRRKLGNKDLAALFTEKLSDIPGASIRVSPLSEISMGGGNMSPVDFMIQGPDNAVLQGIGLRVMDALSRVPGLVNVDSSSRPGKPELSFVPDRRMISEDGLTVQEVALTLRAAVDGIVLSTYKEGGDEYDIRVMLKKDSLRSIEDLRNIPVVGPRGVFPLSHYASLEFTDGYSKIMHSDRAKSIEFTADLLPGTVQSAAMAAVSAALARIEFPSGYSVRDTGTAQIFKETVRDLAGVFVLAVVIVFMILAGTLENFRQPLLILATVPLFVIGVVAAVALTGKAVNVLAMLGIVMLIGLAVTNAILILEYYNRLRGEGSGVAEALVESCKVKLKPILMSNTAIIMSLLPMALGVGASGAEMRVPMGIVTIGGLVSSTFLTLYIIPALENLTAGRRIAHKESRHEA
ncbi:MAG: efflux RND transporter permease subunit [Rectinemataceae bacterium]